MSVERYIDLYTVPQLAERFDDTCDGIRGIIDVERIRPAVVRDGEAFYDECAAELVRFAIIRASADPHYELERMKATTRAAIRSTQRQLGQAMASEHWKDPAFRVEVVRMARATAGMARQLNEYSHTLTGEDAIEVDE